MPGALITLDMAKQHLKRAGTETTDDPDVQQKVDDASAMIREYLSDHPDAATWDETTVPGPVRMATLVGFTYLFFNRGADETDKARTEFEPVGFYKEIQPMLIRFRPLVIA